MNADNKTCYHCDRVLPEKINPVDALGGVHGQCDGCRDFKAAWYAELQKSACSATAIAEQSTL